MEPLFSHLLNSIGEHLAKVYWYEYSRHSLADNFHDPVLSTWYIGEYIDSLANTDLQGLKKPPESCKYLK